MCGHVCGGPPGAAPEAPLRLAAAHCGKALSILLVVSRETGSRLGIFWDDGKHGSYQIGLISGNK